MFFNYFYLVHSIIVLVFPISTLTESAVMKSVYVCSFKQSIPVADPGFDLKGGGGGGV